MKNKQKHKDSKKGKEHGKNRRGIEKESKRKEKT